MPLDITVTAAVFVSETKRGGVMGKLGWNSKRMDAVRDALTDYHLDPSSAKRQTLTGAVYTWKTTDPHEFDNRDRISGGVVRKLAVQCGLDDYRPPPSPAVKFIGLRRHNPDRRRVPQVVPLNESVVTTLKANAADSAVLVIDLYGEDLQAQGLNQRYGADNATVTQHIQDLLGATSFDGPRGKVTVPVFVCCKNTTPVDQALIGTFKGSIGNPVVGDPVVSATNSVLSGTGLAGRLREAGVQNVFVTGFDANMCVAVTIFGSGAVGPTYIPGLLDEGFDVITSRFIVASGGIPLRSQDGWPYMGPCNK